MAIFPNDSDDVAQYADRDYKVVDGRQLRLWGDVYINGLPLGSGGGGSVPNGDKGDIIVTVGGSTWTIDEAAVTNAKLDNMATNTIKGRITTGSGPPEDLTAAQTTALLNTFTSVLKGLVPASSGGTTTYLCANGTWTVPPGTGGGGAAGHASFVFNATTTAPPASTQIRMNNASQTAATTLWVSKDDFNGLDVSVGLAKILPGHQIYLQDYDDASKWVKYNVTAAVDSGVYHTFTIAYQSGPVGLPTGSGAAGRVELQGIAPGTVGVPPGGTTNQVLGKTSNTDYAVSWRDDLIGGGGGGITTEDAVDAVATALTAGNNIDVTYNDALNTITIDVEALTIADIASLQATLDAKETPAGAQTKVDTHVNDTTAAHLAASISYAGGTGMSATDVEAAIDELATEKVQNGGSVATIVQMTQAAYTALGSKNANTLYVIVG